MKKNNKIKSDSQKRDKHSIEKKLEVTAWRFINPFDEFLLWDFPVKAVSETNDESTEERSES